MANPTSRTLRPWAPVVPAVLAALVLCPLATANPGGPPYVRPLSDASSREQVFRVDVYGD